MARSPGEALYTFHLAQRSQSWTGGSVHGELLSNPGYSQENVPRGRNGTDLPVTFADHPIADFQSGPGARDRLLPEVLCI